MIDDLQSLVSVNIADVYKAGVHAATLTRTAAGIEFSYTDDYLSASERPVATTLPLSDQPLLTHAGAVPPFFAGLLPEGRRLSGLRRAIKTSADDELTLLLAVGTDVVGDVQVVPEGEVPTPAAPLVTVDKDWSELSFTELLADSAVVDRIGLPGVQEKVSARMISVPVARAGERFLLKLNPPEFPYVVENEAYFLNVARTSRMQVAHATVVHDANQITALLVRRFDRIGLPDGTTAPLACEDACQILAKWPADKYNVSAEEAATAIADVCAARALALRAVFEQFCFAWLTGNGDLHAKNLSVLGSADGEWKVSPAYDLPSTVPYGDTTLALSIGGRRSGISRQQLLHFASLVGLPEKAAISVLENLTERLAGVESDLRAGALPFSQHITADLVAELRHRRRQIVQ